MKESLIIRPAMPEDAQALLEIYSPYVMETAISFEYSVPTLAEFQDRIRSILTRYPYLVATHSGIIIGYAYASTFKPRAAYGWGVETSIYVAKGCHGLGVGRALYQKLEAVLRRQNILNINACIAYPNREDAHLTTDSEKFHSHMGFNTVAHFHQCGYKFGTWYDMIWMEKLLAEHPPVPAAVRPFLEVWEAFFA